MSLLRNSWSACMPCHLSNRRQIQVRKHAVRYCFKKAMYSSLTSSSNIFPFWAVTTMLSFFYQLSSSPRPESKPTGNAFVRDIFRPLCSLGLWDAVIITDASKLCFAVMYRSSVLLQCRCNARLHHYQWCLWKDIHKFRWWTRTSRPTNTSFVFNILVNNNPIL